MNDFKVAKFLVSFLLIGVMANTFASTNLFVNFSTVGTLATNTGFIANITIKRVKTVEKDSFYKEIQQEYAKKNRKLILLQNSDGDLDDGLIVNNTLHIDFSDTNLKKDISINNLFNPYELKNKRRDPTKIEIEITIILKKHDKLKWPYQTSEIVMKEQATLSNAKDEHAGFNVIIKDNGKTSKLEEDIQYYYDCCDYCTIL